MINNSCHKNYVQHMIGETYFDRYFATYLAQTVRNTGGFINTVNPVI